MATIGIRAFTARRLGVGYPIAGFSALAVESGYRGRGLGRSLVRAAVETARTSGEVLIGGWSNYPLLADLHGFATFHLRRWKLEVAASSHARGTVEVDGEPTADVARAGYREVVEHRLTSTDRPQQAWADMLADYKGSAALLTVRNETGRCTGQAVLRENSGIGSLQDCKCVTLDAVRDLVVTAADLTGSPAVFIDLSDDSQPGCGDFFDLKVVSAQHLSTFQARMLRSPGSVGGGSSEHAADAATPARSALWSFLYAQRDLSDDKDGAAPGRSVTASQPRKLAGIDYF